LQCPAAGEGRLARISGPFSQLEHFAMQSEFRAALVHLCNRVLHPLVRILVRFGVSAGELKSIVDSVYARAGLEYLREAGERATYSRLAVITGINRAALTAILAQPPAEGEFHPRSGTQLHRAARVLNGWHDDADFQTAAGRPAVLPVLEGRSSFRELAVRYSGGVYYRTILAELEHVGAVERMGKNRVRAVRRALGASGASADALYSAADVAGDLMATLDRNFTSRTHEQLPVRSLVLPAEPRSLPLFRAQAGRRADAMLEQVDAFLQAHGSRRARSSRGAKRGQALALGAAVFAICRQEQPPAPLPRPRSLGGRGRSRS
jgi:Family of unknown function (DUF6502)